MKRVGKKFTAKKKLQILKAWDGTDEGAVHTARIYACSSVSIWLWNKLTKHLTTDEEKLNALENKSSRPHNCPRETTTAEINIIKNIIIEEPNISRMQLYYRARANAWTRSLRTLDRQLKKINFMPQSQAPVGYIPKPYDTPKRISEKVQIDVKYVPFQSLSSELQEKQKLAGSWLFFQYTAIDECSRERFTWITDKFGAKETIEFIKRLILFFGYRPRIIQTDNGSEFGNSRQCIKKHVVTQYLESIGIEHKQIRPYCPRQNGKVERSHRIDNEEFYSIVKFTSLEDARAKAKEWLYRYNTQRCHSALGYKTPEQKREQSLRQILNEIDFQTRLLKINHIQAREHAFVV